MKNIEHMELGNLMFGNSRGTYEFPSRALVDSEEWRDLCEKAQVDPLYGTPETDRDFFGFDNDVFTIRPYYWGEDDNEEASLPNFHYKPTDFRIDWYKYAFRDSYMNQDLSESEVREIFKKCAESISGQTKGLQIASHTYWVTKLYFAL